MIAAKSVADQTADAVDGYATVIDWWQYQAKTFADRTAVVTEDRDWTYQDIDRLVKQFASILSQHHCGKGTHVGLCVDRSAEAIAAMLAVMQIGAAFVPLDPDYPVVRLAEMVCDAEIDVIIGHAEYRTELGSPLWQTRPQRGTWIDCESVIEQFESGPAISDDTCLDSCPAAGDLAYLMYTSGSTGKPKGVEISARALVTYCIADIECYRLTSGDRTLQFSTLCFDIAIEEIFPPLLSGGSVVVRPRERAGDRNELSALIKQFDITAIHLATAYWHSWVDLMVASNDKVPSSLRLVIATGEKVSVQHYRRWKSISDHEMLWCNAYGPTEATVTATVFIPDETFDRDGEAANMPIGKPLPGYTARILDNDFRPIGDGESGELCIGGPALADGYHKRPQLTDAAFIDANINGKLERLYRTGDVARWLPDGNIDFGGRFDHQIKLGSYRIEPGEIEAAIDKLDGVLESLVSYDEVDAKKFLVAYIARGECQLSAADLAGSLRDALPPYMIPARYVMMSSFPKTVNGKIDRAALPAPATGEVPQSSDHALPRNELEQRLSELWQEVLHLPDIGIHDDFFLLGGSSLLVMQVITRLTTDLSVDLPVRDFFANPTIATSARQIRKRLAKDDCDDAGHRIVAVRSDADDQDEADQNDADQIRARLPAIEPAFFPSDGHRLFSVRYRPPERFSPSVRPKSGVVMAHSIGHEYTRGYRNLQQLAVQLAQMGFEVLRFDYAGTGNSSGDCDQTTVQSMQQNLIDAREHLIRDSAIDQVAVVGLRFGASVAASLPIGTFDQTILWDPVQSGEALIHQLEQFHQEELVGMTRFNRVRKPDPSMDQLYGYRWSDAKRESVRSLTLVIRDDHDVVTTDDEIRWEDSRFNEAAFSSPKSFAAIANVLSNGASS